MPRPLPLRSVSSRRSHRILRHSIAALVLGAAASSLSAATFTWSNVGGNWSQASNWQGNAAPTGGNVADVLVFGGDVGNTAGTAPNYTATNDLAATNFLLTTLTLNATDTGNLVTDPAQILAGSAPLFFGGVSPSITQNGAGGFTLDLPVKMSGALTLNGSGAGVVTLNKAMTGIGDLTKSGSSIFRFGSFPIAPATTAPSDNTWLGGVFLTGGTLRFNNNADSGRTALRANPITLSTGTTLNCASELRTGVLSGTGGTVESVVIGTNTPSEDLVITALNAGSFGGTLRLGPPTGTGTSKGRVLVRGAGTQTLTGTLAIDKDVWAAGSVVLGGTASLGSQAQGAIVMAGGTFRLDNVTVNNTNRLRDGSSVSTGLDVIGGGTFSLSGNAAGTNETIGRLQLGAATTAIPAVLNPRSGHLVLNLVHRSGTSAASVLTIAGYERNTTASPFTTVEFTCDDGAGTQKSLGLTGSNPRIVFAVAPILSNSLLANSSGTALSGWATARTLSGLGFATQASTSNGVAVITPSTLTSPISSANSTTTTNGGLTGSASIATAVSMNSLRLAPTTAGSSLTMGVSGSLATTGIILTGINNYTITGGSLLGSGPRYVHVDQAELKIESSLGTSQPLVKAGAGVLELATTDNSGDSQVTALNQGTLRATPGTTLPSGELRLRGGVLEIVGGTCARELGAGVGTALARKINWSNTDEDRGSGGFAAKTSAASITLSESPAVSVISWEDIGFVKSGYALILGSATADQPVTLTNNLSLTSTQTDVDYNAREIRVVDNAAVSTDWAILSGVVSGTVYNDLLKTGNGLLVLNATNTYRGSTYINAGTLQVSGSIATSLATVVQSGATLAGAGSVGPVILENGGILSPGVGAIGTLTTGSVNWRSGGVCRFDLGSANSTDTLTMGSGSLVKDGAGSSFAFDFNGTGQTGQTYTLATFGSTTFSASDFSATNLTSGVTGSFQISGGALKFVTGGPIDTWRQSYFGPSATNSGTAADTADAEGDGLNNITEYVMGTNPLLGTSTARPAITRSGNAARISFNRNVSATDVTLTVQANVGLVAADWATIATLPPGGSWSGVGGVTISETSGAVTVTDVVNVTGTDKRFYRLLITR